MQEVILIRFPQPKGKAMTVFAVLRQGTLVRLYEDEDDAQQFATAANRTFAHAAPTCVIPWNVTPSVGGTIEKLSQALAESAV